MRRRKKSRWPSGGDIKSWLFNPLAAVLGVAVLGAFLFLRYAPEDGSPAAAADQSSTTPRSITAILLDVTDPFTPTQQTRITNELEAILDGLKPGARVDVYVMDNGEVSNSLASLSNPGDGTDRPAFFVTKSVAKEQWRELFRDKVMLAIKDAGKAQGCQLSNILEALNAVSARSFSGASTNPPEGKRLIVVSDMLQNTGGLQQFRGKRQPGFQQFRQSRHYRVSRPTNLEHAEVLVLYVRRLRDIVHQNELHKRFWQELFEDLETKMSLVEI